MQSFDYSLVAADYTAGIKRLQRRIEKVSNFWDNNHPPEPFWPVHSWLSRLSKWKKERDLFIQLAMDVDWRITFSKQMMAAKVAHHAMDSASALYGQMVEDPLPKLERLLAAVPYENTGFDREKIILLLILDDDGSSWDLPVELLMQLVGIPAENCALALVDLHRTAETYDETHSKKSKKV